MSGGFTKEQVVRNIRNLPTEELKEYKSAYRKGQIHKYAMEEAERELKRRLRGNRLKTRIKETNTLSDLDRKIKKMAGGF
jgi:ribosomal protein S4